MCVHSGELSAATVGTAFHIHLPFHERIANETLLSTLYFSDSKVWENTSCYSTLSFCFMLNLLLSTLGEVADFALSVGSFVKIIR